MSPDTQSIVTYTILCVIGTVCAALCCIFNPYKREPKRVRFHPIVEKAEFTPLLDIPSEMEKIDVNIYI